MEETNTQIQTVDSRTEAVDTQGATQKLQAMIEFVKANLKEGNDYMSINGGKPTLLKSGAEKTNILMGYFVEYEKSNEIMRPEWYFIEIKAILRNKQGQKIAECLASCNSEEPNQIRTREKSGMTIYGQFNTILKMAEKRAYVGATLNANALSQFYTQDMEDEAEEKAEKVVIRGKEIKTVATCISCGTDVSEKVASYSKQNFQGKVLCFECQKQVKSVL